MIPVNVETTADFTPLFDQDHPHYKARYKVWHGGRGGRKSWEVVHGALCRGITEPLRILCTRELQTSIKDSIHRTIADRIEALDMSGFYTVYRDAIRGINGTEFIFKGLRHNASEIKSTEGIDVAIVEEAEKVSDESWTFLTPTIRKPGSEIWVVFNPDLVTDPTYQRYVVNPPEGSYVCQVNYDRNPQLPAELEAERLHCQRVDLDAYAWIWEGKCRQHSDAQVLKGKWNVDVFEPGSDWDGPYYGADWGFARDPTTLVKCWISRERLYIEHEAYGVGVGLDDTPALFDQVSGAARHTVRADSARPETIHYMRSHGYPNVQAVSKWPGSVVDGVQRLRAFDEIIIHQRCKHTIEEARLWSYQTDRLTGDVLPKLKDGNEHLWDAVRYALEPIIKGAGNEIFVG